MQLSWRSLGATAVAATSFFQLGLAQEPVKYTDQASGVTFGTWAFPATAQSSAFTFGLALPENALTVDSTEYIGLLRCSGGWCGISHGPSGGMTNALLLVAWAHEGQVLTSFRFATGYQFPPLYTGNATLTQISSSVTSSGFEILYRCQNCLAWNQAGAAGAATTSQSFLVIGRAQGKAAPSNPSCPNTISFGYHDDGFGQFGAPISNVVSPSYAQWAAKATKTVSGSCGGGQTSATATSAGPTSTPTASSAPVAAECSAVPDTTYDYVVIGGGAGGIPVADKLSEAGHKVLLLEKGPPSTGKYGGNLGPAWLNETDLTRFDVPGLCNQIWVDSEGIACKDTDQMAGCVLGGGTAVNAGLWWKPPASDWDKNFPEGWRSTDVAGAVERVFKRIPGTSVPSQDGQLYRQEGFNVLAGGLEQAGYKLLEKPNDTPNEKNHTYGHTVFMFAGGERGGPLATYLATAVERENFKLVTDTAAKRVVRSGAKVTGVEVECTAAGGLSGTVKLSTNGGVIVAAGTFGSAKLLLRSGIGPQDQLKVVQASAEGTTMAAQDAWINLPVGSNLVDHVNTDMVVRHKDVVAYDFYKAWDAPDPFDKELYLEHRAGILATAAPNIGPMIWDEIEGADGSVRQLQWTSRVEGSLGDSSMYAMTMSQYLGRGSTSRGRMTITPNLDTVVTTPPYLREQGDVDAVVRGIEKMRNALKGVKGLVWISPPADISSADYVKNTLVTSAARRSNHWMGTNKLGTDDGRSNGTAVVDTNTKVYGTENLFVVDASIFPGQTTGNPSAMIVIAAEHAAEKILSLRGKKKRC